MNKYISTYRSAILQFLFPFRREKRIARHYFFLLMLSWGIIGFASVTTAVFCVNSIRAMPSELSLAFYLPIGMIMVLIACCSVVCSFFSMWFRLNDLNMSGFYLLIVLIPQLRWLFLALLIMLFIIPSSKAKNKFGDLPTIYNMF